MHFLLYSISVVYVLTTPMPEDEGENPTVEQVRKKANWDNDDYVCRGLILNELGSHLRIEESLRVQDSDKPKGNNVAGPLVVNMVEHNNSSSDLCDLYATPSLGNKKYFVTFIDDASRFYVIEPNDSVAINSIIESRDAIFDEQKFSSVPRPRTRDEDFDQHSYCFNVEDDPKTFDEAIKSHDVAFWKEAINDEMDSIMGNNTWVLTNLPPSCKPLGCKWIFKRRLKLNGTVKKFKARLVIQGFKQKLGIDYFDTYGPVARISTIRLLISMTSIHNLIIHQMDVKTAFLNGELEEEVYMNQPMGFIMPGNDNKVCKLIMSLYGLKHAPKQWHQKFDEVVLSNGYLLNQADKYLTKEFWSSRFFMKDMGEADVILGIRIKHESNGIAISLSHYIEKVLKNFNYSYCTPVSTPLDTCEKLMPNKGLAVSQLEYSRVISCLMYAMTCTIPDITFTVGRLIILQYWKVTQMQISNTEDNSSTSSWVFVLGGGAISWASKKQTCIIVSTMESEFVALAAAGKKAKWLKNLLFDIPLWVKPMEPLSINCVSAATLAKAYSQMYNGKSRHLGVRHSMIRELITNGVVSIEFVRSQQNLVDHLMKEAKAHVLQIIPMMCLEPTGKEDEVANFSMVNFFEKVLSRSMNKEEPPMDLFMPVSEDGEYGIPEALHPKLPRPEDRIVDFPEGKIHLSQLSVIGAAKVSHFEINCRVLNIIPTLSHFRVFYTPSFNSGWMSFSKRPGKNTLQCYTKPLDSLKNWNNRFFWVDKRVFPTVVDWRTSAPKDGCRLRIYSAEAVRILDAHRTPIQKQPEELIYLVGLSRRYYLGTRCILYSFMTMTRVGVEDSAAAKDSSGVPSTIKRSPLDFANEAGPEDQGNMTPEVPLPDDVPTIRGAPEASQAERVVATDPPTVPESRKRGHDRVDANAPPKVLRRDHADPQPTRKSAPADVSDPDPLSFADPWSRPPADVAQSSKGATAAGDSKSENTSFASVVVSPESIYRLEWGIANGSMLDTPEACQDLVDHVVPPGYFLVLRYLHNDDFLRQYNVNMARQVAMGSQLRLRFEQDAKLLKKSVAQVARRDKRIQAREHEIKNLKALLEAEADMKKAAEDKKQVSGEEKLKAAFEEFKQYEGNRVEQRCAEMDVRLDALSIDFDEELYPHMLTAIASHRWMIGRGLRLAVVKCSESLELRQAFVDVVSARIAKGMSEGLRHGVEHGQTQLNLEAIEAYDPEAEAKYIAALQALKNLKYPLVDQLEGLKDAPMDVIMAALPLKSDTGDDAPQWVRDLHPSSSQLTIHVYPEVRDPMDPWACKEEMLLADAIAANIRRAKKKKKFRVVCRTHGVGSTHHARSDGVLVFVPTVVPHGLAILLADAATQTESDEVTLNNL
nr:zinc finger, CCHC-type [Tanacetum cinerariifolium]